MKQLLLLELHTDRFWRLRYGYTSLGPAFRGLRATIRMQGYLPMGGAPERWQYCHTMCQGLLPPWYSCALIIPAETPAYMGLAYACMTLCRQAVPFLPFAMHLHCCPKLSRYIIPNTHFIPSMSPKCEISLLLCRPAKLRQRQEHKPTLCVCSKPQPALPS